MANNEAGHAWGLRRRGVIVDFLVDNAVLAVVYVLSAKAGLVFALAHGSVSLVWPPAGIALAALVVWGLRMLPGAVAGAFAVNLMGGDPWPFAVATALGNPAEALVGALLLTRLLRFHCAMDRVRDILGLPFLAAPVSAVVAATIGTAALWGIGSVAPAVCGRTWFHWWLGDATGIIVVAPVVFALQVYGLPRRLSCLRVLEGSALTAAATGAAILLFGTTFSEWPALSILIIPLLILIAFRFTFREVAIANLLVAAGAVIGAGRAFGTSHPEILGRELLTLAALLVVMSLTAQLLSALHAQRNRTERALRSERQQLLDIIEFLPDATFVIDRDKRVIAWNRACETMTGAKKETMLGRGDYAYAEPFLGERHPMLIDLLDRSSLEAEAHYKYIGRTEDTLYAESFVPHLRGGQGAHLWGTARMLFDPQGQRCGAIEVIRDVTEEKRTEQALHDSERKHRTLFENAGDAILLMRDGRFIDCNPRTLAVYGCPREQILGTSPVTFSPPRQPDGRRSDESALEKMAQALAGKPQLFEWEHRRRDKTPFTAEVSLNRLELGGDVLLQAVVRDISARKQAEEALRQSEATIRSVFRAAPIGIGILKDRVHQSANKYWCEKFGYQEENIRGKSTRILFASDEEWARAGQALYPQLREKGLASTEARLRCTDGSFCEAILTVAPIQADDPSVGMVAIIHDITERKAAERALHESEQKYRELVEHANSIILRWNAEGRITFLNEFGLRFFGYSSEEILGRPVIGTITPITESSGHERHQLMELIRTDPNAFEQSINENIRRNGERVWIAWTNKVAFDEQGRLEGILSIGSDITERKQAEFALRENEARYRGLFEDCPTSLWEEDFSGVKTCIDALRRSGVTDLKAYFEAHPDTLRQCASMVKVLDVNRATLELLQYERREDMCARLSQVFREETYEVFIEELVFLASGHSVFQTEAINRNRKGQLLHVNMSVAIVPGHEETWSRVFVSLTDISPRVRAEEELRTLNERLEKRVEERTAELALAKERAESADRLKSAFLAAMSHELRTPLNSIIGFTGIVLQGLPGPLNPEQKKQLGMVQGSARHLLDLINDVLDLSKIEAGQLTVETKPFDARGSLEKVVRSVAPLAERKGLMLSAEVSPEVGELTGDRRRFEQILINLINNGIKFTETGHVRVTCTIKGCELVTRVVDTGIGIKPEDMGKLFQAFQQVDMGLTRNHEGTGLGLSICKRLVEKLGGRIWVESEWGVGSTFAFALPIVHS